MSDVGSQTDVGSHADLEQRRRYYDPTDCQGRMIVRDQTTIIWELRCDTCGFEAGLPARDADPLYGQRLRHQQAGLPARFTGRQVEETDENRPVLRELRKWLKRYPTKALPAPAIYGLAGRGKTHLLVALCERLIRECNATVLFRSSARLLDDMQAEFDDPVRHSIWRRALTVPVLALDDLGAERSTDWRTERLARLVDERWERDLPIVVATNFAPRAWEDAFDARTASRLRGMTYPIELRGPDRRQSPIPGVLAS